MERMSSRSSRRVPSLPPKKAQSENHYTKDNRAERQVAKSQYYIFSQ